MNRKTAEKIFEGVDYNNHEEITELYTELEEVFEKRLESESSNKKRRIIVNQIKKLDAAYKLLTHIKPARTNIKFNFYRIIDKTAVVFIAIFLLLKIWQKCDQNRPKSDLPGANQLLKEALMGLSAKIFTENEEGLHMEMVEVWLPQAGVRCSLPSIEDEHSKKHLYIGRYEVTYYQFKKFLDDTQCKKYANKPHGNTRWEYNGQGNPENYREEQYPAVNVSWNDAMRFCEYLSEKTGKHYRLPTEAEWEYAANSGRYNNFGSTVNFWYKDNSNMELQKVGLNAPNRLGLHDMIGNVWEWCADGGTDSVKVVRGGSFLSDEVEFREIRQLLSPDYRDVTVGFRVVWQPS